MTPQPIDYIFVEVSAAYTEEILLDSGLKLYLDASYNKNHHATVVGRVVSLPLNPKGEAKSVVNQLSVGSEICFSYSVISDISFSDESGSFHLLTEGSPYFKKWLNSKGEQLSKIAMPGVIGQIWVSVLLDSLGERVDGVTGSEKECDRFLAQFSYGDTDTYKFNRLIEIDGKEIWMAMPSEIYAKKVGNELVSVGTRVLLDPIDYKLSAQEKEHFGIILTADAVVRLGDRAKLISGAEDLGIKKNDILSFESRFCEKYSFYGKEIYLLKPNRILGTWQTGI